MNLKKKKKMNTNVVPEETDIKIEKKDSLHINRTR